MTASPINPDVGNTHRESKRGRIAHALNPYVDEAGFPSRGRRMGSKNAHKQLYACGFSFNGSTTRFVELSRGEREDSSGALNLCAYKQAAAAMRDADAQDDGFRCLPRVSYS